MKNISTINLQSTPSLMHSERDFGNRWVEYGYKNQYPEYLRSLFLQSPTNQAVINAISNMIAGESIKIVQPELNPKSNAFLNMYFDKDILTKLAFDLKLYGYAVLIVQGGKEITGVKYSEALKWRSGQKDEKGNINTYWFCDKWGSYQARDNKPVEYPMFGKGDKEAVLLFQLPKVGFDYYAPVDYYGGMDYINLEAEIGEFHLSAIQNGMMPAALINFNNGAATSEEEKQEVERMIKNKFGGSSNAGKFIVSFNESKESAADLHILQQTEIDKQYAFLSGETTDKILLAHRVTSPMIFGVSKPNGLSNNSDELRSSYLLFHDTVIVPFQKILLNGITRLLEWNLLFGTPFVEKYMPFAEETATELSKENLNNEINSLNLVSQYKDLVADTSDKIVVSETIFNGKIDDNKIYKFVKSSNNKNIFLYKMNNWSNDGKYFKPDKKLIKNTGDYFWMECSFVKKGSK